VAAISPQTTNYTACYVMETLLFSSIRDYLAPVMYHHDLEYDLEPLGRLCRMQRIYYDLDYLISQAVVEHSENLTQDSATHPLVSELLSEHIRSPNVRKLSAYDERWSFTPFPGVPARTMGVCIFNKLRHICHEGNNITRIQKSRNRMAGNGAKYTGPVGGSLLVIPTES
jgi:hypothetical protein